MVAMFVHIKGSSSQGCEIKGSSFQGCEGTELNSAKGDVAQSAQGVFSAELHSGPPFAMRGSRMLEDSRSHFHLGYLVGRDVGFRKNKGTLT